MRLWPIRIALFLLRRFENACVGAILNDAPAKITEVTRCPVRPAPYKRTKYRTYIAHEQEASHGRDDIF